MSIIYESLHKSEVENIAGGDDEDEEVEESTNGHTDSPLEIEVPKPPIPSTPRGKIIVIEPTEPGRPKKPDTNGTHPEE